MPDAREHAVDALIALERPSARAKDVVDPLRAALSDPRERGLLTEIVYGVARRQETLDAVLEAFSKLSVRRLDPVVRAALRAALHQALFLERVPPSAAVDAAVGIVKRRAHIRLAGFTNGVLRTVLRSIEGPVRGPEDPRRDVPRPPGASLRFSRELFPDPAVDLPGNLALRYAHPAWLVERWVERLGLERARAVLEVGCVRPPLSLRARPGTRDAVIARLAAADVAATAGEAPDEVIAAGGDAAALDVVREGLAFVQDGTAQRVAPLVDPRAGERILDLCAAPGGKALHLLDLLGSAGEVVACDVDDDKVTALAATLTLRAPPGTTSRALKIGPGPLPFEPASFDAVLVDAPCSNSGVLRRRPEARRRLKPLDVVNLAALQDSLLARAAPLVRPGGRLVYATCSIEPEENEQRVARLVADVPSLSRGPAFFALPTAASDGGFAALLRRE